MTRRRGSNRTTLLIGAVLVGAALARACAHGAAGTNRSDGARSTRDDAPSSPGVPGSGANPETTAFEGCPPEGDGADRELNLLKNRTDAPRAYSNRSVDAFLQLGWPREVEHQPRWRWSMADRAAIGRDEGEGLEIEGYLAGAKEEGRESPNCHAERADLRDFHIWLVAAPTDDRTRAIVVEATPRMRAQRPGWRLDTFRRISTQKKRVRVRGFSMFDPEHPDQLGKTRGTLWEIHPILHVDVLENGAWTSIDE